MDRNYPGRIKLIRTTRHPRPVYSHMYLYRAIHWTDVLPGTTYWFPTADSENVVNWVVINQEP